MSVQAPALNAMRNADMVHADPSGLAVDHIVRLAYACGPRYPDDDCERRNHHEALPSSFRKN